MKPQAGTLSEKKSRVDLTGKTGENRQRLRVARECHSAVHASPKVVNESRDRGCNNHRILRRVPNGGRHSGSQRSVIFHEKAIGVVLVISASSDPC